jgi:hypothetical protein
MNQFAPVIDGLPSGPDAASPLAQHYLAFISYRRGDGGQIAHWLRERIGTFKPPRELVAKVSAYDERVGGRFNRVFFDMSYQRSHTDFWNDHIAPSVERSDNLLLLLTPSVFEKLPGGEPNWVEREIDTFLNAGKDPARILLLLGPGAPTDRVPDALAKISDRWDWADLRFFSPSSYTRWRRGADYDAQLTKILARIYDIADGELPALTREFERARARVYRRIYTAGAMTITGLTALTIWAMVERQRAVTAEHVAVEQRDEAVRQRNAALVAQSLHLTEAAGKLQEQGATTLAMKLLLAALPDKQAGNDRPLVADTILAAYDGLYGERKIANITLPPNASAAVLSATGDRLVAVTEKAMTIIDPRTGKTLREIPNPGGLAVKALLTADATRIALLRDNGEMRVQDLKTGDIVVSNPGFGAAPFMAFVDADRGILIQSADGQNLIRIDLVTKTVATRHFTEARTISVSDGGNLLMIVADGMVRRLSPGDLTDHASRPTGKDILFAFTKVPGENGAIAMGAGDGALKGRLAFLDPDTLAERKSVGLPLGTVSDVTASTIIKQIAVNVAPNLVYIDTENNRTLPGTNIPHGLVGHYVASGYRNYDYYALYGEHGVSRLETPGSDLHYFYRSEDGGTVNQLIMDPDGQVFTTVTATPAATRWSSKDISLRKKLALEFEIKGFHIPLVVSQFTGSPDLTLGGAQYSDGSFRVWDPIAGTDRIAVPASPARAKNFSIFAWAKDSKSVAIGGKDGEVALHSFANDADKTAKAFTAKAFDAAVAAILPTSPTRVAVQSAAGALARVDRSGEALTVKALAGPGACPVAAISEAGILCERKDGALEFRDLDDGKILWTHSSPNQHAGHTAVGIDAASRRAAFVDSKGLMTVRSLPDGAVLQTVQIFGILSGPMMMMAVKSPMLDQEERDAILKGAREVKVKIQANWLKFAPDGRHMVVAMPEHSLQWIDLTDGSARVIARSDDFTGLARGNNSSFTDGVFSAHGTQFAAIARNGLLVYDFDLEQIVFSRSSELHSDTSKVFATSGGSGFMTSDALALAMLPVFERTDDLVALIKQRYPGGLTPKQRHLFHAE